MECGLPHAELAKAAAVCEVNPLRLFWESFEPASWSERPHSTLVLTLSTCAGYRPRCGGCRRPVSIVHAHGRRWIRERDLLGLHGHTVKALDAARLERELPSPDRSRLR